MKRVVQLLILVTLMITTGQSLSLMADEHNTNDTVYTVPVEDDVERGLVAFMERSIEEAEENFADHIIFEIDTPGGQVDSANEIARLLTETDTPTTAYVKSQALSAGSYIALMTDSIYMNSGSTMGASGVITGDGNAASEKAQSAWISAMEAAAERNERDPLYARAMADPSVDLTEYGAGEGDFLTLGPSEAVEVGYAEGEVTNRDEVIEELGYDQPEIVENSLTISENIARFVTNPVVISILLSVASIGLIVELYSPGFGIAGIMGGASLLLFFYGHLIAGFAGYEAMILLLLGLAAIVIEIFVPSGIFGVIGGVAILGSLLLSGADLGQMAVSLSIAIIISIIVAVVLFKKLDTDRGIFKQIVLKDQTSTEKGYITNYNRDDLIGHEGTALTFLRPSGTAIFGEERLDVVTEGQFIDRNQPIKIVKVEGSRIVVREIK